MSGYIDSYYARTLTEPGDRPSLDGTVDAEICVIGGGLAGLATALDLAERGRSVALIEEHRIGWGASGRNGGFLSPGYPKSAPELIEMVGIDRARELYALSLMGHGLVLDRIERYGIDCGPVEQGQIRCSMAGHRENLEGYCRLMNESFGLRLEYWPSRRVRAALATERYDEAFHNPHTYRLHPLNLARGMARAIESHGGRVFEQSAAGAIDVRADRRIVRSRSGQVRCDQIVVACGGYVGWLHWPISAATVPIATFVMVTEPLGDRLAHAIRVPYAVSDIQHPTNYYRPLADGRLMWGGRVLAWQPSPRQLARQLGRDMVDFYPGLAGARVEVAWGGFMGYLGHRMPAIRRLHDGLWCATGFGGLGLATTAMAGRLIGSAIADGDDRWRLFDKFGLPFAGGTFGRIPAQMVYWRNRVASRLGRFRNM
jgi:gamma-glutamylputrescine oxidase